MKPNLRRMRTWLAALLLVPAAGRAAEPFVLSDDKLKACVDRFNAIDHEDITNAIPNAAAVEFLRRNVPLFECPDGQEIAATDRMSRLVGRLPAK
ncbi:MAG: hypothetical protein NTY19_20190 [Planctomycetota bacterium]|nr:hypothetical protein [Planctomycetota bacterium]